MLVLYWRLQVDSIFLSILVFSVRELRVCLVVCRDICLAGNLFFVGDFGLIMQNFITAPNIQHS
jgi:hypothetical protein